MFLVFDGQGKLNWFELQGIWKKIIPDINEIKNSQKGSTEKMFNDSDICFLSISMVIILGGKKIENVLRQPCSKWMV